MYARYGDQVQPEELFVPPPGPDLLREPRHRLLARLPGLDKVAPALAALDDVGIQTDEAYVICGDEGIRRLDPTGKHHGLKGRLIRAVQFVTSYGDLIQEDADFLGAGGVIVTIPAEDPDDRERVQEILRAHGAFRMVYFGDATYEELG
jgi:hypothetical protein